MSKGFISMTILILVNCIFYWIFFVYFLVVHIFLFFGPYSEVSMYYPDLIFETFILYRPLIGGKGFLIQ